MKTVQIQLSTIRDVQDFVGIATAFDGDIDLTSGRYVVDAKSIIGIFSLDLLSPITLRIHSGDADKLIAQLDRFIVK
ncbi:MAG: HPr family phosphocarrier protein [Eubacteriales bacterium]|jgi:phosphotransferase system HPr-like phosphotransfer protein